jgi:hypothetical protein
VALRASCAPGSVERGPRWLTRCGATPQIFEAYCTKKSLARDHVRFLFDGNRIQGTQTPSEVRFS